MTENEAIKVLKKPTKHINTNILDGEESIYFTSDMVKAFEMAIQALKDIQKYKTLGENAKAKKENAVSLDEKAAKALECVENLKAWIPTAEDRVRDEDTYRCIQEVKDIVNGNVENYSFAKKESKIPRPDEKATIVLHSIDKDEFEIIDITFHNEKQDQLMERVSTFQSKGNEVPDNIYRELCAIDGLQKMVTEDLGDYGEVAKYIHRKLWEENGEEYYYTIDVEVGYTEDRDYWTGEVDYDVDFDYHVTEISKEYEEEEELRETR